MKLPGCAETAARLEGFLDRLLPRQTRSRGTVIVSLIMGFYAAFTAWSIIGRKTVDFATYYLTAALFLNDQSPYGAASERFAELARLAGIDGYAIPYFYPPFAAALVAPLTLLPFGVAAWVWNMASAAAVVAGTALLLGDRRWRSESLLAWLVVAAFVPVLTMLQLGQVSGILYLLVALAIFAHERGHAMSAGAALACGALIKITPIVLVGYFLWRGDWRAVAGATLGAAVLVFATLPIVGVDAWTDFFAIGLATFYPVDAVAYAPNFTLNGMFLRLFTESEWAAPVALAPGLVRPLWIGSAVLVVATTLAVCWPPFRRAGPVRLEIAFILIAVQLIPHFTFFQQLTLSLLPAGVLLLSASRPGSFHARWVCGVVFVVALVDLYGIAWRQLGVNSVILAIPVLAVVALWAALGRAIVRGRVSAPAP